MFTLAQYKEFLNITIDSVKGPEIVFVFMIQMIIMFVFCCFLSRCMDSYQNYSINLEKIKNENNKRLVENLENELKIKKIKNELGQSGEYIIDFGFVLNCIFIFLFVNYVTSYNTVKYSNNTCDFSYTNHIE